MRLRVFVESDSAFQRWVDQQRAAPATPAKGSPADAGQQVFRRSACIGCHTIAGVAQGKVGPDLSHVGGRATIAGRCPQYHRDAAPLDPERAVAEAGRLDAAAERVAQDLDALIAYLQSLK